MRADAEIAAETLIRDWGGRGRTLALAESCTAGLVADLLVRIPGASRVLWGSFVCYTAAAKVSMLGLDPARLEQHGLVSRETALGMAQGALAKSGASVAASVTGLAGPDGDGSAGSLRQPPPVGTVWVALATREGAAAREFRFAGSRNEIRLRAAGAVLEELLKNTY